MSRSKVLLQGATALLGLVPLVTGAIAMLGVADPLYASARLHGLPVLDSNLRFFGGLWLGLGVALLCIVPSIDRQAPLFRAIWGAIFVGGIGRVFSMLLVGLPPVPFIGFTALELAGAPLFIFWQCQVARSAAGMKG